MSLSMQSARNDEAAPSHNGVLDVSDLRTDRVTDYAREAGRSVHLERRGGRTFLVTE